MTALDLPDLVRPKGVWRDCKLPRSLILEFSDVPTDDDMRAWHEAADTLSAMVDERKDWARRFKLNGVTPWDWMTRAQEAEDDRERLTDDVAALMQQNIDLKDRAERADASDAAWRILCGGKQKIIKQLEAERDALLDSIEYLWKMADIERNDLRAWKEAEITKLRRCVEAAKAMRNYDRSNMTAVWEAEEAFDAAIAALDKHG